MRFYCARVLVDDDGKMIDGDGKVFKDVDVQTLSRALYVLHKGKQVAVVDRIQIEMGTDAVWVQGYQLGPGDKLKGQIVVLYPSRKDYED